MSTGELTRVAAVYNAPMPSLSVRFHQATNHNGARFSVACQYSDGKRFRRRFYGYDYSLDTYEQVSAHVAAWLIAEGYEWAQHTWTIARAGSEWVAVAVPQAVAS